MRWLLLLAMLPLPVTGQFTLYTCMVTSKEYVVGAKLPPSGIFLKAATGEWRHAGYNHPFINAMDFDPADPGTLYVAAGNGLIRVREHGEKWKILTGSDVTELQDVSVDRHAPGTVYFSHTAGIRVTHDGGATWSGRERRAASEIHHGDSRGFAQERLSCGGQRRGNLPQRGRRQIVAPRRRRRIPGTAHRAIAARRLLLDGGDAGRRPVRVHRLRRQLRERRESGRGPQYLRYRVRPGSGEPHRGGGMGRGRRGLRRSRQDVAIAQHAGCRRARCGASRSTPPRRAACMPAYTKRRSMCRRITARRGPGTGWKAAASFA